MEDAGSEQNAHQEHNVTFASKEIKSLSALRFDPRYLEQTRSADVGQELQLRLANDPPKLYLEYEMRRLADYFKAWVMEHELGMEGLDVEALNAVNAGDVVPPWDFAWTDEYLCDPSVPPLDKIQPLEDVNGHKLTDELSINRGCDCEDDECDPKTCACLRRAAEAYPYEGSYYQRMFPPPSSHGSTDAAESAALSPNFVYTANGLIDMVNVLEGTPIFECNNHCTCSSSCRNRVVQKGKKVALAFWKTESKGWGIKAMEPLPRGAFVGAYGGELLDDQASEARATIYDRKLGTTYLQNIDSHNVKVHLTRQIIERELAEKNWLGRYRGSAEGNRKLVELITRTANLIETYDDYFRFIEEDADSKSIGLFEAEKRKREQQASSTPDVEARIFESAKKIAAKRAREAAIRRRAKWVAENPSIQFNRDIEPQIDFDDPVWNFLNLSSAEQDEARRLQQVRSDLEDKHLLTVDSALWGNHTRFFNHSCDPNIYHVPVYTDNPSIMRPLLAFFTLRPVAEGEELCFNYRGNGVSDEYTDVPAPQSPSKGSGRTRIHPPTTRPGVDTVTAITATPAESSAGVSSRLSIECRCGSKKCTGKVFS